MYKLWPFGRQKRPLHEVRFALGCAGVPRRTRVAAGRYNHAYGRPMTPTRPSQPLVTRAHLICGARGAAQTCRCCLPCGLLWPRGVRSTRSPPHHWPHAPTLVLWRDWSGRPSPSVCEWTSNAACAHGSPSRRTAFATHVCALCAFQVACWCISTIATRPASRSRDRRRF